MKRIKSHNLIGVVMLVLAVAFFGPGVEDAEAKKTAKDNRLSFTVGAKKDGKNKGGKNKGGNKKGGNKKGGNQKGGNQKGGKSNKDYQVKEYDPNTKVYVDHSSFRVHKEDCKDHVLKEKKKTMTLEEADKAGASIGSNNEVAKTCCLKGYLRKHPMKPVKEKDQLEKVPFAGPQGWQPKPFSVNTLPPEDELEVFIQETLWYLKTRGRAETPSANEEIDPIAKVERFYEYRYFFPNKSWLRTYIAYRGTGDKRLLEGLLETAQKHHKISVEYPAVAQHKARVPEGMSYMWSMAACARITLQLARKYPRQVSQKEVAEAEAFLKTMVSVLKPTCEATDDLDPEMGLPKALVEDLKFRAYNRNMNGIATLGMIAVSLEDLQKLKNTKEYQPTIDRYRKTIKEYLKYWKSRSHFCKVDGNKYFVYPYAPRQPEPKPEGACVIFKRPEDAGHYSHTLQGLLILYQTMPEIGVDDDFMTAIANAMYLNTTTEVTINGDTGLSGYLECPTMMKARPYGKSLDGGKHYTAARERFYPMEAFRNGLVDALCQTLDEKVKVKRNRDLEHRTYTLYAQYMKALRKDRSLIHLGEKK
ncbi:hypothetical protein BVX97_01780 [bacterium E08(2017)]|nr:hypothetical protein BVX97_01780 [bacterium E08(2017)]